MLGAARLPLGAQIGDEGLDAVVDVGEAAALGAPVHQGDGLAAQEVAEELGIGAALRLGRGEALFAGLDLRALGYECVESVASEKATHVVLRRSR